MSKRSERMKVASDALLADLVAFVKASPCDCTPLFDDQPDGAKFGSSCERCKLLERAEDLTANRGLDRHAEDGGRKNEQH